VNDASDERRSSKLVGDEDHIGQLSQESKSSPGEETCDPRKLEALVSRGVEEKITTTKVKTKSDEDGTRTTTSLDRVQAPLKHCSNRSRKALGSPRGGGDRCPMDRGGDRYGGGVDEEEEEEEIDLTPVVQDENQCTIKKWLSLQAK